MYVSVPLHTGVSMVVQQERSGADFKHCGSPRARRCSAVSTQLDKECEFIIINFNLRVTCGDTQAYVLLSAVRNVQHTLPKVHRLCDS